MSILSAAVLGALVLLLWLPPFSELLCLIARPRPGSKREGPLSRFLFLVPAHNEHLLISSCVSSLVGLDYPATARRVIVVADNCDDDTATLARAAGAECLERTDLENPGKPHALAWALSQIQLSDWDAAVIIDADTVVDSDFASSLDQYAPLKEIVVQANFLVRNEAESWLTRLGGVLSRCRYEVSYPLKERARINCPMTGNGMCIGAGVLEREGWKAFSITEDSELYVLYTVAGVRIRHGARASLRSQEVSSMSQGVTQRRRWLAGRLWVVRRYWREIVASRAIGWHQKLDLLVELLLSSPVLHGLLAVLVAGAALAFLSGPPALWLAGLALLSIIGTVLTTLIVLWRHPEPWPTLVAFLHLPVYAVWRVLLFLGTILTIGDKRWKRTARKRA